MKALAIANYLGEKKVLPDLETLIRNENIDLVFFAGGIVSGNDRVKEFEAAEQEKRMPDYQKIQETEKDDLAQYEAFFKTLGEIKIPVYYIPGKYDAPVARYLREAYNYEIVYPQIRNVHKSFSLYRNHYIVTGFGGEISEKKREEDFVLRYPRWEVEYHLKIIRDLKPMELVMMFYTPPYGGKLDLVGNQHIGSQVVEDFIKTYDPTWSVVGTGAQPGEEIIGTTHVINPGSLKDGQYAVIQLRKREVRFGTL
ncbi:MAG: hypothetical protein D6715_10950 [Calditrichaeota bacterium]|nr:MAG: hypothetical protein D6715_10950 [Calditrichota bacterium]